MADNFINHLHNCALILPLISPSSTNVVNLTANITVLLFDFALTCWELKYTVVPNYIWELKL